MLLGAVPPTIGKHNYDERLVLRTGASAVIEIPFSGSPEPTSSWKYKNGKLPDPRRFKTDTIKTMTSMTLSKAKRSDSGKYTLILENEYGKVNLNIDILVLGKKYDYYSTRIPMRHISLVTTHTR